MKKIVQILGIVTLAVALTGCHNLSRTQKNTAIGAAVGGVAGNVIGGSTGATLGGAALGGLIGSQSIKSAVRNKCVSDRAFF